MRSGFAIEWTSVTTWCAAFETRASSIYATTLPHRIYGQHVSYMFLTPTTAIWKRLYDQGVLEPPRTFFWETKSPEEL